MKKMVAVLVSLMVVACNSNPSTHTSSAAQAGTKPATQAATPAGADQGTVAANDQASVYFDKNNSAVAPEYRALIQKEAAAIKGQKNEVVKLEGNCDERGSDEYNLALGQRRADAVKQILLAAGVQANQVKTTSLGKEKPKASCHDESCWKENRRVDFVQG
ncbi:MAG TPA: peptidoglycan-associated lipoprotein Pal [Gallionellaceae bacterium]